MVDAIDSCMQVITSVTMGQIARSKLIQQLSLNTAKALQVMLHGNCAELLMLTLKPKVLYR
jgi:hypothetical protein